MSKYNVQAMYTVTLYYYGSMYRMCAINPKEESSYFKKCPKFLCLSLQILSHTVLSFSTFTCGFMWNSLRRNRWLNSLCWFADDYMWYLTTTWKWTVSTLWQPLWEFLKNISPLLSVDWISSSVPSNSLFKNDK